MDAPCWTPGILSANYLGILNPYTWLRLGCKLLGLAHRKHLHPARQSLHTGGFLLVVALEGLY
jgi:hypothetical protein